jgi:predicted DCC family thiol-disulfide oxidoreductase YuxK
LDSSPFKAKSAVIERPPYSYRNDPTVASFPDDKPIIVFDGYCAVCSRWARFVMRHDPSAKFRLLAAQTPLGHALYVHYGLDPKNYETNILIADGIAWFKAEGTIRMFESLGRPWSVVALTRYLPHTIRTRSYEALARNRFRFGRRDVCFVPTPDMAARFLA